MMLIGNKPKCRDANYKKGVALRLLFYLIRLQQTDNGTDL